MIRKYSAGDNIASHCTKCKLMLDHAIVAMDGEVIAKVKCKTCGSVHKYRIFGGREADTELRAGRQDPQKTARGRMGALSVGSKRQGARLRPRARSTASAISWTTRCSAGAWSASSMSTSAISSSRTKNA